MENRIKTVLLLAGLTVFLIFIGKIFPVAGAPQGKAEIKIGKGEDLVDLDAKVEKVEPVKDSQGKENEAATLIKGMHKTGGEPLFKR